MTTYDGDVQPGGPAQFTGSSLIEVGKLAVDPETHNNCYLLVDRGTGARLLIDPAAEPEAITAAYGTQFAAVVVTHRHWDHHRALAAVVAGCPGLPVYAGAADAAAITEQTRVEVTHPVADADTIAWGDQVLTVIGLVGHTPGSIALLHKDPEGHPHLFTGDSLFPGGVGNTFSDAAAFTSLINDVETKIFDVLPDDTRFYPGHGKDSTLGAERPHLAEWRARGW